MLERIPGVGECHRVPVDSQLLVVLCRDHPLLSMLPGQYDPVAALVPPACSEPRSTMVDWHFVIVTIFCAEGGAVLIPEMGQNSHTVTKT